MSWSQSRRFQAQSSTVPPKHRAAAPRHSATTRRRAVRLDLNPSCCCARLHAASNSGAIATATAILATCSEGCCQRHTGSGFLNCIYWLEKPPRMQQQCIIAEYQQTTIRLLCPTDGQPYAALVNYLSDLAASPCQSHHSHKLLCCLSQTQS